MFFGHFGKPQTMRKSLFSLPVSTLQQGLSGITVMNFFAGMTTDVEGLSVSPPVHLMLVPTPLPRGDPSGPASLLLFTELLISKRC